MITNIKKVLTSRDAFMEYRNKLDYVAGVVLPQEGDPMVFPCIAITSLHDDQVRNPSWKHAFIYSNMEDLLGLLDRVDDASLEKIAARQGERYTIPLAVAEKEAGVEVKKSEWEEFWDKMEAATPPEGCKPHVEPDNEERDFLLVQGTLKSGDQGYFLRAANWFLRRWPGTLFRSAILRWMQMGERPVSVSQTSTAETQPIATHQAIHQGSSKREVKFASGE